MKQKTIMLLLLVCTLATHAQVVLYSEIHFGGTGVSFSVGNHRFADMNVARFPYNGLSSFSIPAGYPVIFLRMIILLENPLVPLHLLHGSVLNGMTSE